MFRQAYDDGYSAQITMCRYGGALLVFFLFSQNTHHGFPVTQLAAQRRRTALIFRQTLYQMLTY